MKKTIIFIALVILLVTGFLFFHHGKIIIQPIKAIDTIIIQTDNGNITRNRFDNYKISNFGFSKKNEQAVDSFVRKHLPTDYSKYSNYRMIFYEAVDDSDTSMLNHRPDRFYNQGNTIYEYVYSFGRLEQIHQFNDGRLSVRYDIYKNKN